VTERQRGEISDEMSNGPDREADDIAKKLYERKNGK
jgi:hypothetical protein